MEEPSPDEELKLTPNARALICLGWLQVSARILVTLVGYPSCQLIWVLVTTYPRKSALVVGVFLLLYLFYAYLFVPFWYPSVPLMPEPLGSPPAPTPSYNEDSSLSDSLVVGAIIVMLVRLRLAWVDRFSSG